MRLLVNRFMAQCLATVMAFCLCRLAQEEEELKVQECQSRLNASLVNRLPQSRAFYTGVMQPTELSRVCRIITYYSACDTNALGFCRRIRPTPPPTDYFFMSLANFCYNGAFNDYPTLFLCYRSASRRTSDCYEKFRFNTDKQAALRRGYDCRLYRSLVDCVAKEIGSMCGEEAVKLVEPLLEISVPTAAFCTSNKFMKYVVSLQNDKTVNSGEGATSGSSANPLVSGDDGVTSDSASNSVSKFILAISLTIVAFIQLTYDRF
uniref:DUF19 domain-containing protein n=1 Tax=Macrostomum lignano TaxID=282301 RepID=A0A1I8J0H6_9PLAT